MSVQVVGAADVVRATLETLATRSGLDRVVVAAAEINETAIHELRADERTSIERAVDRRKAEFATGRQLLRSLLATDQVIRIGPRGRPVAPGGEPISVAHDEHIAVAVAVLSGARHLAIGVDIEPWATFPAEVGPVVVRPDEGGIDPCLAFCVKEAAYKAWSAHGGGLLGHDDVRITIDGERANARVVADGVDIAGVWASGAGRCLALAWLRM